MLMVEEELWLCHILANELLFIFLMRKICEILYGCSAEGYECTRVYKEIYEIYVPFSGSQCVCMCLYVKQKQSVCPCVNETRCTACVHTFKFSLEARLQLPR